MKRPKPLNRHQRVTLSGPWRVLLAVVTLITVGFVVYTGSFADLFVSDDMAEIALAKEN